MICTTEALVPAGPEPALTRMPAQRSLTPLSAAVDVHMHHMMHIRVRLDYAVSGVRVRLACQA